MIVYVKMAMDIYLCEGEMDDYGLYEEGHGYFKLNRQFN